MNTTAKSKRIDITLSIKTVEQIDDIWHDYGFAKSD
jgi:hypothetical protein